MILNSKIQRCLVVIFFCGVVTLNGKDFKVYYLGGQSNMDGFGYVKELPSELREPVDGVWIFHGNPAPDQAVEDGRGLWAELRPGHGTGFVSDGLNNDYSDRFGVELTFARRLRELDPEGSLALIKYSRGGTSIAIEAAGEFGCWDPDFSAGNGVNQYDHFLATVRRAMSGRDLDGDGEQDRLIPSGIVWMQGESDAFHSENIAQRYESNLKRLMDLIRAALRRDDLPVVVGRISDSGADEDGKVWNHGEMVRTAQAEFVRKDSSALLVTTTDTYAYSDRWHYDGPGYVDLGRKFAEAMFELQSRTVSVR